MEQSLDGAVVGTRLHRPRHAPVGALACELHVGAGNFQRVDFIAFDIEHAFVAEVEGLLVERRLVVRGNQEDALLAGFDGEEIAASRGPFAQQDLARGVACALERDREFGLGEPVGGEVAGVFLDDAAARCR